MGGREAARIPELSQSHRAGDKVTTGEIDTREASSLGLDNQMGEWGIMRNEEEVKDAPKPLLPVRVTGGQRAHRQGLDSASHSRCLVSVCHLSPALHSCQRLLIPGPLPPSPHLTQPRGSGPSWLHSSTNLLGVPGL